MSDTESVEFSSLGFDDRTTNTKFNQRLLAAKESSLNDQIDYNLTDKNLIDTNDPVELRNQLSAIESQTQLLEIRVKEMEQRLESCKEKRLKDASITNMSPEERAQLVEQDEDDTPDMDVIFEYLLLLESTLTEDALDFSKTDFLIPSKELREKGLNDPAVLRQTKQSKIKFTEVRNRLETSIDSEGGEIRRCDLQGTCYDESFRLILDVREPKITMLNLDFEVDIAVQLAVGELLQKVKEECNVLGFFQLLSHYASISHQRKQIFNRLVSAYEDGPINIEVLSNSSITFESSSNRSLSLLLTWKVVEADMIRPTLDANIKRHIQPEISFEAVASVEVIQNSDVLRRMNQKYMDLVKLIGIYDATKTMVDKLLR